jgi:hypothetical protein
MNPVPYYRPVTLGSTVSCKFLKYCLSFKLFNQISVKKIYIFWNVTPSSWNSHWRGLQWWLHCSLFSQQAMLSRYRALCDLFTILWRTVPALSPFRHPLSERNPLCSVVTRVPTVTIRLFRQDVYIKSAIFGFCRLVYGHVVSAMFGSWFDAALAVLVNSSPGNGV